MGMTDKLVKLPVIRKRLLRTIVKREGGDKESETLRRTMRAAHKTTIGKYTYGSCFSPGFNGGGEKSPSGGTAPSEAISIISGPIIRWITP